MANANFTPDIGPYTTLKPFRFWCQKVLPLVYDDSLSYYELLGKVVDYLNKTMEDVDTQITDIQGLLSAYEALQGWVNHYYDSADFAADIDAGLDRMAASGQLTTLLTAIVNPELPGLVDDLLPEVVLTLLPDEVSSQIGGTVATQLPGVVSNQIPGTVATQLPAVVSNQIPGTVATQLPAVVSNQIGPVVEDKIVDPVEDWLDANVSGGIAVDRTLSVLGAGADAAFTGARLETLDNTLGYDHVSDTGFIITTASPYVFNTEFIDNDNASFSDSASHTYKMMVIPVNTGDKYCINAHKISIADITADHFAVTYAFCAKYEPIPGTDVPRYLPTTYSADDAENVIATVPEITIPTGQGYDETTGYLVVITADIEDPVYKVVDEGLRKDVDDLKSDLADLADNIITLDPYNITLEIGTLGATSGGTADWEYTIRTKYIQEITNAKITLLNDEWRIALYWYKGGSYSSADYLGRTTYWSENATEIYIEEEKEKSGYSNISHFGIVFFRWNGTQITSTTPVSAEELENFSQNFTISHVENVIDNINANITQLQAQRQWAGKGWSQYGDSISTYAVFPNTPDGGWATIANEYQKFGNTYMRGIGGQKFAFDEHGGSVSFINSDGSLNSVNQSYNYDNYTGEVPSGTTKSRGSMSSWLRITSMFPASMKDNVDLVFVMGGTNDSASDTAPTWVENSTADPEWTASNYYSTYGGDYNIDTIQGGVASMIMKMQAWMPDTLIVIGTPLNGNTGVTGGIAPSETPDEYQKSTQIMNVARMYGIPVIDVFGECGINNLNSSTYISDGVHPNSAGRVLLGRCIAGELNRILPKS